METSKNERALRVMGLRFPGDSAPAFAIDMPCELGFWCPVCRVQPEGPDGQFDERLDWSEYAGFLWCSVCNYDYPSALCVRLEGPTIPQRDEAGDLMLPSQRWGGREYAVSTFLSTVERAAHQQAAALHAENDRLREALSFYEQRLSGATSGDDRAADDLKLLLADGGAKARELLCPDDGSEPF